MSSDPLSRWLGCALGLLHFQKCLRVSQDSPLVLQRELLDDPLGQSRSAVSMRSMLGGRLGLWDLDIADQHFHGHLKRFGQGGDFGGGRNALVVLVARDLALLHAGGQRKLDLRQIRLFSKFSKPCSDVHLQNLMGVR